MRISKSTFNNGEYTSPQFIKMNKDKSEVYSAFHTCRRCGGTGHHSYNQVWGTVCMECCGTKRSRYTFTVVEDTKWVKEQTKKQQAGEQRINDMIESFFNRMERQAEFAKANPWARKKIIACYNPEHPDESCIDYTKCCYNLVIGQSFTPDGGRTFISREPLTKSEKYLNIFKKMIDNI